MSVYAVSAVHLSHSYLLCNCVMCVISMPWHCAGVVVDLLQLVRNILLVKCHWIDCHADMVHLYWFFIVTGVGSDSQKADMRVMWTYSVWSVTWVKRLHARVKHILTDVSILLSNGSECISLTSVEYSQTRVCEYVVCVFVCPSVLCWRIKEGFFFSWQDVKGAEE